ncbi:MAG: pirin family protein [Aeromicrobium sp.]
MTWSDLLLPSREVPLGGVRGITVHRTLPHRDLPTVGAWCFVDYFGPSYDGMHVLPHPHTGLQTVTWPMLGEIRHKDNLGSDIVLKPGELNLMTAGRGVSHSEFDVKAGLGEERGGPIQGLQLWVALPEDRRHGPAGFENHADLPVVEKPNLSATVFMGSLDGATSPATIYSPMVGAELTVRKGSSQLVVDEAFEHAVMILEGNVSVNSLGLSRTQMLYMSPGRTHISITAQTDAKLLLVGGEPFEEELVMWWNFIGRTHDEIAEARADWERGSERFGSVAGHGGQVIPAPNLPNVRLTPRRRRAAGQP